MSLIGKLMTKPWVGGGVVATEDSLTEAIPPAKIGLWLFLCTISAVFGLFMVAYQMRIVLTTDWVSIPKPTIVPTRSRPKPYRPVYSAPNPLTTAHIHHRTRGPWFP